ncbi:unnamed protein product [Cylicocyclus nassatus]|uniref:Uncharacterized protein n=1 Tax=Cylicocyclus nassatus TaxID=53992 RepID=A0AA36GZZ3_CYLNA|nr:unnamed protein product [Cylicocyclus nassatus]
MRLLSVLFCAAILCTAFSESKQGSPKAVGPCILNRCPRGFECAQAECIPNPNEIEELGPCVNNMCPKSYQCNDDICIRPKPKARAGAESIGPCVNDLCPDNHFCVVSEGKCYPMD